MNKTAEIKDCLSAEVGSDGVKVSAQGAGVGRLQQALADLVSPLTEGAGYIGDFVRLRRLASTTRALEKAHELAKQRGFTLKPVPSKFLIEWLEKSSLEDTGDEELVSLWAKLLVAASENSQAAQVSYLDLLRKLGPQDAQLLRMFAFDANPNYSKSFHRLYDSRKFVAAVPGVVRRTLEKRKKVTHGELLELLEGAAMQFNCQLLYTAQGASLVLPTKFYEEHEKSVSMLEREGAIKIRRANADTLAGAIEMCWLELTKYGFDFVWACEGHKPSKETN